MDYYVNPSFCIEIKQKFILFYIHTKHLEWLCDWTIWLGYCLRIFLIHRQCVIWRWINVPYVIAVSGGYITILPWFTTGCWLIIGWDCWVKSTLFISYGCCGCCWGIWPVVVIISYCGCFCCKIIPEWYKKSNCVNRTFLNICKKWLSYILQVNFLGSLCLMKILIKDVHLQ